MTSTSHFLEAARNLASDWDLILPENISEEHILLMLELKISRLLQGSPEVFFGLMYRLDIPESKLQAAFTNSDNAVSMIAWLVYQRQLQKAESRATFRSIPKDGDEALRW